MPILIPDDKEKFFPEVPLEDDALQAAIWRAESVAEGAKGANRTLSLVQYTQTVEVLQRQQVCYLPHWPIVEVVSLEARSRALVDSWGRTVPELSWTALEPTAYELNRITGKILLTGQPYSEVRATYTAGWDFRQNTPDTQRLKAIVGQILVYQLSEIGLGYKSDGDVDLQTQAVGTVPDEYLIPLHAYRSRQTVF